MLPAAVGGSPEPGYSAAVASGEPILPQYGGACLSSLLPAVLDRHHGLAPWLPANLAGARQVLLLVLDGLGWEELQRSAATAPTLHGAEGGPITSVAPTTTATALTSITTARTPAEHGVVGYRMAVGGGRRQVLNVLRWTVGAADARRRLPAALLQPHPPFSGRNVPAVTRSEFAPTGFTAAHLSGARLVGWRTTSTLVTEALRLMSDGEPFVYAYYDGLDKVAHEHGLGAHYAAELRAVDRLVGDLVSGLPGGAALVVTADHGQVEVGSMVRMPGPELMRSVEFVSGEGRFRWLHARPGAADDLYKAAEEAHGEEAWVRTRQQVLDEGWFGGPLTTEVADRLGDVALAARRAVAFLDPADTGETLLAARHGSLTSAEMFVPLLCWRTG
jgi:predicted AlkP superfamily pyrophosphatase or phosphodiesterase